MSKNTANLIFVVDWTASMGDFCRSVSKTLKQLFYVIDILFEGKAAVHLVAYGDYCDKQERILAYAFEDEVGRDVVRLFAESLEPDGGGDIPEASKTAFRYILSKIKMYNNPIIIHYTDAPPHHEYLTGSNPSNFRKEKNKLSSIKFDWMHICTSFKNVAIYTITNSTCQVTFNFWLLLGNVIHLTDTTSDTITKNTMQLILQLMGQETPNCALKGFCVYSSCSTNEHSHDFKKFVNGTQHLYWNSSAITFPALFPKDLKELSIRFSESKDFRELVFETLEYLLHEDTVMIITYNTIFGTLWRMVCKMREDTRVSELCDKMGNLCSKLPETKRAQLKEWVDDSYDNMDEICITIGKIEDPCKDGVLVLDVSDDRFEMPTREETKSILHSPTTTVLKKVQNLLTKLVVVHMGTLPCRSITSVSVPMFIPLGLNDNDLFSLIFHLIIPGLSSTTRPTAIIAILAYLSGNAILAQRAKIFLDSIRGKWIPSIEKAEKYPEILNTCFVNLVLRVPDILTTVEKQLYKHLKLITRIRNGEKLQIPMSVGFTPTKINKYLDYKRECMICGIYRSFTIMVDDTCGICIDRKKSGKDNKYKTDEAEPGENVSHMVECRTCCSLYGIVNKNFLTIEPKCHYCRFHIPIEFVQCSLCKNKFTAPTMKDRENADFVCAVCTADVENDTKHGINEKEIPLGEIIVSEKRVVCSFGFSEEVATFIFGNQSLFKLWTKYSKQLDAVVPILPETIVFKQKPVLNCTALLNFMLEQITSGSLKETCVLCFEDKSVNLLQSACGLCNNLVCKKCLSMWFGGYGPGELYSPSKGLCAFCKRVPKAKTLKEFNPLACKLSGRKTLQVQLRADMHYGWCKSCWKIAEAVPRECAAGTPFLTNFECDVCKTARMSEIEIDEHTKQCPGCSFGVFKAGGCDHMTCIKCETHWCWKCGWKEEDKYNDNIYDHLNEKHGGFGIDGNDDYDSE